MGRDEPAPRVYKSQLHTKMVRVPVEALELAKVMLPLGQSFNLGGLICDVLIDAAERIDVSKLPAHRRLALQGAISYAKSVGSDPERPKLVRRPNG